MKIRGTFYAQYVDGPAGVFPNEITPEGVQRVLQLMGGQSAQPWSSIRLIGAQGEFVERLASTTVEPGRLVSTAIFEGGDVSFDPIGIEMYSGSTKVAEAPFAVSGGRTLYVERHDELSAN